jgi:glutamyl-tRNA synthetase
MTHESRPASHAAPVLRFAPSPTGRIHIGNARTALLNALVARREGGTFILRFDDTDRARSRPEFESAISEDVAWLGIAPDLTVRQSERLALYEAAAETLRSAGRLYPCYETEEELDRRRKLQAARGLPPVYDRAALKLTADDRARLEAEGRRPHWRFLLDHRVVSWHDLVRGDSHIDCASLSDPVLVRADGSFLYTLPSVVDDLDLRVTQIVRGEDHVTNTAVQIQIAEALGGPVPAFGHHNLLTTAEGEGLSKRLGHLGVGALREEGYEPLAVAALAVLVGSAHAIQPVRDLDELAGMVDLARLSRAPARFDEAELAGLNARLLHLAEFATVAPRLAAMGVGGGEAFWLAVRANLVRLADAREWWHIIEGPVRPVVEEPVFTQTARDLLPPEPWDSGTWSAWTDAVKAATGRKGKLLFMPLRLALTGLEHGPELRTLLPLIGRVRASARLAGENA